MPRKFIEHAETGIYFRVIQTGQIKAGDLVTINYRDPAQLSVKRLFKAYFDKQFSKSDATRTLSIARGIKALSSEWLEKVESRLAQS